MDIHLKVYRGYANEREIIMYGHVFKSKDPNAFRLDQKLLKHALTIFQLFRIKTLSNVNVEFHFKDIRFETKTLKDGYFHFRVPYSKELISGWHTAVVKAYLKDTHIEGQGEFIKPYSGVYGLISDIDDTFLISHSNTFFKKIYILLTRNIKRRKIFDGVLEHYQLLATAGRLQKSESNVFFYVSSSEWNLYGFIESFTKRNNFPKAVIQLKNIKRGLLDLLFTGGGSHDHKFNKIKSIIEFYPELRFILLGDDSQKDPFIYERIVKLFPKRVEAIYIRQTAISKKIKVITTMKTISSLHVDTCYFLQSSEAMEHSRNRGIV